MKKQLQTLTVMAAALSIFLQACDKNDQASEPAITYPMGAKAVSLKSQGPVRLFIKNGEVKDEAVIKKFIAGNPAFSISIDGEKDIIKFENDSTARFGTTDIQYKLRRERNRLIFTQDLILEIASGPALEQALDALHIRKNSEPIKHVPSMPGGGQKYQIKEIRAALGNPTSFTLPLLAYKVKRKKSIGPAYEAWGISGTIFNEFNDSFLESLTQEDTVAYRQYYVDFKKI